jgi:hypothetical protein
VEKYEHTAAFTFIVWTSAHFSLAVSLEAVSINVACQQLVRLYAPRPREQLILHSVS